MTTFLASSLKKFSARTLQIALLLTIPFSSSFVCAQMAVDIDNLAASQLLEGLMHAQPHFNSLPPKRAHSLVADAVAELHTPLARVMDVVGDNAGLQKAFYALLGELITLPASTTRAKLEEYHQNTYAAFVDELSLVVLDRQKQEKVLNDVADIVVHFEMLALERAKEAEKESSLFTWRNAGIATGVIALLSLAVLALRRMRTPDKPAGKAPQQLGAEKAAAEEAAAKRADTHFLQKRLAQWKNGVEQTKAERALADRWSDLATRFAKRTNHAEAKQLAEQYRRKAAAQRNWRTLGAQVAQSARRQQREAVFAAHSKAKELLTDTWGSLATRLAERTKRQAIATGLARKTANAAVAAATAAAERRAAAPAPAPATPPRPAQGAVATAMAAIGSPSRHIASVETHLKAADAAATHALCEVCPAGTDISDGRFHLLVDEEQWDASLAGLPESIKGNSDAYKTAQLLLLCKPLNNEDVYEACQRRRSKYVGGADSKVVFTAAFRKSGENIPLARDIKARFFGHEGNLADKYVQVRRNNVKRLRRILSAENIKDQEEQDKILADFLQPEPAPEEE